jgi:hypothetical protein
MSFIDAGVQYGDQRGVGVRILDCPQIPNSCVKQRFDVSINLRRRVDEPDDRKRDEPAKGRPSPMTRKAVKEIPI